jgi:hypothetical protein
MLSSTQQVILSERAYHPMNSTSPWRGNKVNRCQLSSTQLDQTDLKMLLFGAKHWALTSQWQAIVSTLTMAYQAIYFWSTTDLETLRSWALSIVNWRRAPSTTTLLRFGTLMVHQKSLISHREWLVKFPRISTVLRSPWPPLLRSHWSGDSLLMMEYV